MIIRVKTVITSSLSASTTVAAAPCHLYKDDLDDECGGGGGGGGGDGDGDGVGVLGLCAGVR